uniref:Reverse transcriptase n=1 Tax=Triatoma infestans TaxID=30076 RepID=A0A170VB71_TRIIF
MDLSHIVELTANKAIRALMVCRRVAGKSWGCPPRILIWMYTMLVRPIITYGAVAWYSRTNLEKVEKILDKVQRLACLCTTGAIRTCPRPGLRSFSISHRST